MAGLQVFIVFIQVDDAAEERRVVEVAIHAQERHPLDLWRARRAFDKVTVVDLGVVFLDVELPGDPALMEAVEDGWDTVAQPLEGRLVPAGAGGGSHPIQMIHEAPGGRRAEEAVEEHVLFGEIPVVGEVPVVVVAHGEASILLPLVEREDEAVHLAPVVLDAEGAAAVVEILNGQIADVEGLRAGPLRVAEWIQRHTGALGEPVRAGEGPEVVVEGVVLLHEHDDVFDGGVRLRIRCSARSRGGTLEQ